MIQKDNYIWVPMKRIIWEKQQLHVRKKNFDALIFNILSWNIDVFVKIVLCQSKLICDFI